MRKAELEVALDDHLRANQTAYQNDPALNEYYKRLGPVSPMKRIASTVKSEAPEKKAVRRKSRSAEEDGAKWVDQSRSCPFLLTRMALAPTRKSL